MSMIEEAVRAVRPAIHAIGGSVMMLPDGRGAIVQFGDVLRAHVGMVRDEVEILTYGEIWRTYRPSTASDLAQHMIVAAPPEAV